MLKSFREHYELRQGIIHEVFDDIISGGFYYKALFNGDAPNWVNLCVSDNDITLDVEYYRDNGINSILDII